MQTRNPQVVLALLAILLLVAFAGCSSKPKELTDPPQPASTRDGRWEQDVRYLCENLEHIHPNAFANVSESEFHSVRNELIAGIPSLDEREILLGMAELAALLRDAHTSVAIRVDSRFSRLPARFVLDSHGYHLTAVSEEHSGLLLAKLTHVGNVPIEEAVHRLGRYISAENNVHVRREAKHFLTMPYILHAAELSDSTDSASYRLQINDQIKSIELHVAEAGAAALAKLDMKHPEPFRSLQGKNYAFKIIKQGSVVYWQYNSCTEDPKLPFAVFAKDLKSAIDAPTVKRLIIDLRFNGGGGELVARSFLQSLADHRLNEPGGIVVLTGMNTFSSAKGNYLTLRKETKMVSMGQAIRQSANTLGQVLEFDSPNQKVYCRISTKHFVRGKEEEKIIRPEIEIPWRLHDWIKGIDVVLQRALDYRPK